MNVDRVRRILKITQLLQSGRSVDATGLAGEFGVTRRTVFRDLELLELAGVPCRYNKRDQSYQLYRPVLLPPVMLTLDEGLALMLLTRAAMSKQMVPDHTAATSGAVKIESSLPSVVREHCGDMLSGVEVRWWPMSEAESLRDLLPVLQRCVKDRRCVSITYDSYLDDKRIQVALRPYRLLFIRRGWYVIGYAEQFEMVRTFKLERIERIREEDRHFTPDSDFTLDAYFGNAWQMIRGELRHHVRIKFL
ncbi:MAG: WYL domain-containing protein, partial [bacterium]|nr:WYL domain-containing protein [bacterium]